VTLVQGVLTHDYTVQVCDCRVTRLADGAVVDDARNKGIMWGGVGAVAYSGLAEIEGQPTDLWAALQLQGDPSNNRAAVERLQAAATRAFGAMPGQQPWKRHAFAVVCWAKTSEETSIVPGQLRISNALDDNAQWLPVPTQDFNIRGVRLSTASECCVCPPLGASVPESEMAALRLNVRACVRHGTTARPIIQLLAETAWNVACRDSSVGDRLLAMVVPRPTDPPGPFRFFWPQSAEVTGTPPGPWFCASAGPGQSWESVAPTFVAANMVVRGVAIPAVYGFMGIPPAPRTGAGRLARARRGPPAAT
jgi:hypothetical protein